MNSLTDFTEGRGKYVPYELAPGRVDAIWTRLRASEVGERRSRARPAAEHRSAWPMVGGAALAAAACALLWTSGMPSRPESSPWSGTRLHAGNEAIQVALQDGSVIEALPHASLELLSGTQQAVRLALRHGTGRFSVTKNPDRLFVVQAGPVQVRVVGTRFEVRRENHPPRVQVRVEEGLVEVEARGETRQLRGGEALQIPITPPQPPAGSGGNGPTGESPGAAVPEDMAELVLTEEELGLFDEAPRRDRRQARGHRPGPPASRLAPPGEPPPASSPDAPDPGASELLEAAQHAQAAGRRTEAAQRYQQIMRDYPDDARAPLAAFELGRLRMDHLNDPNGALWALKWSLRHQARSAFREDALARLVRSAEAMDLHECLEQRRTYLAEYPDGRYAHDVKRRCASGPRPGAE